MPVDDPVPTAMSPQASLMRQSLPAQVQGILRREIITGIWAPGVRLPEVNLCERFGVSRTPLREALKALEAEGLLMVSPNKGAVVTDVSVEDIRDRMRVLRALEILGVEIACEAATDAEVDALERQHLELEKTFLSACDGKGSIEDFYLGNFAFHQSFVELSHNKPLIEAHRQMHRHLERVRHLVGLRQPGQHNAIEDHHLIVAALRARDAETAMRCVGVHFDDVLVRLMNALRQRGYSD